MFDQKKVKELVLTTLVTDAFSLGAHWVYDEKQLRENSLNWNNLNAPLSIWHKGKSVGDFTHYGDQTYWLYKFLEDKETFDDEEYLVFWESKINTYNGYVDGATRDTLENVSNGIFPSGSTSTDLSIIGRITPLLKVSKSKDEFLANVEKFVVLTHNSEKAVNAAKFFAKLLIMSLEGKDIKESIMKLKDESNSQIQSFIDKGLASSNADTFETIRAFGPACDIDEGFSGIIHLLSKYTNFQDMITCNAMAGGDSSARGMVAAAIFMANQPMSKIPTSWLSLNVEL